MANSALVNWTRHSPNHSGRLGYAIDTITIHCMAGDLSVESCGAMFAKVSTGASSNYGIGSDGRIALYVDETDCSWASSDLDNDRRAVTIEVANCDGAPDWPVSDAAYGALIELVADICRRNGIQRLVWSDSKADRVWHKKGCNMTVHRDFAAKACPGNYLYHRMGEIAAAVNARLNPEEEKEMEIYHWFDQMPDWARPSAEKAFRKGLIRADAKTGAVNVYACNLQPLVWMDRLGLLGE